MNRCADPFECYFPWKEYLLIAFCIEKLRKLTCKTGSSTLLSIDVILSWSKQLLETLDSFVVVEREGQIIACAALFPFVEEKCGEVAPIAVSPECRGEGQGDKLLGRIFHTKQVHMFYKFFRKYFLFPSLFSWSSKYEISIFSGDNFKSYKLMDGSLALLNTKFDKGKTE